MYSEVNMLNYNSSDSSQWFNHTIIRELNYYEIFDIPTDPPSVDDFPIILIIFLTIATGSIIGVIVVIKMYNDDKIGNRKTKGPVKHNPKLNSKIKSKK